MPTLADPQRPKQFLSSTFKPGENSRACYRYLKRSMPKPREGQVLYKRRVDEDKVLDKFLNESKTTVRPCCKNSCCAKLLGSDPERFSSCPSPEESMQRLSFVNAVIATRKEIHSKGELESGKRLLNRLRLGFTEGMKVTDWMGAYTFYGRASGMSKQEYWWRTEDEACVQVRRYHC